MKLKKKHTNQNFEIVDSIGKYMDDDIQRIIEGKQLELGDRELPPFDEYRIYKNIQEAVMQEEKRKNRRIRMPLFFKWAVACIIVLFAVGAGYNFYQSRCEANLVYREVCAVRGEKLLVLLPDGSRVWLNADSKLTYPTQKGIKNKISPRNWLRSWDYFPYSGKRWILAVENMEWPYFQNILSFISITKLLKE